MNGNSPEMICDSNSSLGSRNFVRVRDERTGPTLYACAFQCTGLVIGFECTVDKEVAFVFEMLCG